jgi:hypothetical protein
MDTTDTHFNTCVQLLSILGLGLTIAKLVKQCLAKRDELKSIEQRSTMLLKSNVSELFKHDAAIIWPQAQMLQADAAHKAVVAAAVRLNVEWQS